jgi:type I restriction enzyme M protein
MLLKKFEISRLPRPGEVIEPDVQAPSYGDLVEPSEQIFRKVISDLLDKVVIFDTAVTRREEQLDQLCNILLTKLESDKQAKSDPSSPVLFKRLESSKKTASAIREAFESLTDVYPETFTTENDRRLRLSDDTITACADALSGLKLLEMGVSSVSVAFQVLRSEALKQGEGQYFTPQAVIQAGVRLMQLKQSDIIIDPACGTGGFLVESMLEMKRLFPKMSDSDLSRWAQTHIFGVEKDAVGLKLTKAIMQIAGDGSAHCARGDSVRVHKWSADFPHLGSGNYRNGRFTVVLTNPPFGKNLKVSAKDSRLSGLTIASEDSGTFRDLEIGLLFLQRAFELLKKGGKLGIVLPETYFFSPNYKFVTKWIEPRLKPLVVANIPMEAFQGFCRAKTNFYVFEKISSK